MRGVDLPTAPELAGPNLLIGRQHPLLLEDEEAAAGHLELQGRQQRLVLCHLEVEATDLENKATASRFQCEVHIQQPPAPRLLLAMGA